ncbi:MAG: isoprenylcysteine carboxylmethyltransferase family protein [Calditrichia bacterium]|nr:isoprenylcysteine carboxylmethyltransferase family protein [Calditrichia bacterium]
MDIRNLFFKFRGFTPVPLVIVVLIFAKPTITSLLWGIAIMIVGEMIRIWGVAYAGGATRTRDVGAPFLVTAGPFSRVRNPLYLGNILMYSGAALTANIWLPWLVFAAWFFFGIQYHLIVDLEEEKLAELFGDQYLKYKAQVPRFIPSIQPLKDQTDTQPNYAMALRSEKSTFMSFATILILMIGKMVLFPA